MARIKEKKKRKALQTDVTKSAKVLNFLLKPAYGLRVKSQMMTVITLFNFNRSRTEVGRSQDLSLQVNMTKPHNNEPSWCQK